MQEHTRTALLAKLPHVSELAGPGMGSHTMCMLHKGLARIKHGRLLSKHMIRLCIARSTVTITAIEQHSQCVTCATCPVKACSSRQQRFQIHSYALCAKSMPFWIELPSSGMRALRASCSYELSPLGSGWTFSTPAEWWENDHCSMDSNIHAHM